MTTEELRGLDVEIHRRVMGLSCEWRDGDYGVMSPIMRHMDGSPVWETIPAYSLDIAAAWLVVEKLTGEEYVKVRCEQSHYHGDYCSVTAADGTYRDGAELVKRDAHGVWGETMPVAICLAALAASEEIA